MPPATPGDRRPEAGGFNLSLAFEAMAGAIPDRDCLVWGGRHLTYGELAERSLRLASYLSGRGLRLHTERSQLAGHQSGQDHVALALYNGNEYLEAMIASYRARVAPFNVNYRYVGEELRYLLGDAAPRALVYHASLAPRLAEVLPDLPPIEVLIHVADDSGNDPLPGAVDYEEALASGSPAGPDVDPSPDDLYILYTGGTTGMPKGVLWRQHDIFLAAMGGRRMGSWEVVASYEEIGRHAREGGTLRMGLLPPLMHGAAQWVAFLLMAEGATLVMPDDPRRLDPADVWRTFAREGVNTFTVVGDAMLRPLLEELGRATYDTSSVLMVGNGGAPLTPAVREMALARFPALVIIDTAGSSETGAQMHSVSADPATAGTFVPGPGAVVVDEQLGAVLPPGHEGIGWLAQGGPVPLGYLGDPDKTARTFPVIEGNRYSVPGDRARHLADGGIELLGRDSVTINSGGEKIFAEEVERAIAGHPAVADVVVAGRPSERWGEEVVAVVQLAEGHQATGDDVVAHAAGHIARYKLPKVVVFVPEVLRSPSGKADYRWAKEQADAFVSAGPTPLEGAGPTLTTARLVLRPWRESDLEPMAAINGDPETMRYFPAPLSRAESDAFVATMDASFARRGSGLWAVEVPGTAACIGAVGLLTVGLEAHFTPATEVGWRLGREHWGKGYATEAATEALRFAFDDLDLDEVVSFTSAVNRPSRAVMERLGLHRDPAGDFSHPRIAADHRLAPHVLYRVGRPEWAAGRV